VVHIATPTEIANGAEDVTSVPGGARDFASGRKIVDGQRKHHFQDATLLTQCRSRQTYSTLTRDDPDVHCRTEIWTYEFEVGLFFPCDDADMHVLRQVPNGVRKIKTVNG
jgi:hypothetical protein